jgi:hypothetical protein
MSALEDHGRVPIAFEVNRVLDVGVRHHGLDGFVLSERRLEVPYIKDYDAIEREGPSTWARRFDLSNWGLMTAHVEGQRVGGAVIATGPACCAADTPRQSRSPRSAHAPWPDSSSRLRLAVAASSGCRSARGCRSPV